MELKPVRTTKARRDGHRYHTSDGETKLVPFERSLGSPQAARLQNRLYDADRCSQISEGSVQASPGFFFYI